MLAPNDLVSAAERVFAAANAETAARTEALEITRVRALASSSWRLLHQETPAPLPVPAPLFGEVPVLPQPQAAFSRLWSARQARLVGRRGLVAGDGALFLGEPVRNEADLARAAAACASGGEGLMLRPQTALDAQLLGPGTNGERRLTGIGLHLGGVAGVNARPFLLGAFSALLMIAELRPKFDYLLVIGAEPDLAAVLTELELGGVKIFDLDRLQGVICGELLVPVIAQDPTGYVDAATIGRMRGFAAQVLTKLGPGGHAAPVKVFLTDEDRADRPAVRLARERGYQIRGLAGRSVVDQALLMAKASRVATDCAEGVAASLFAGPEVPVLDLAGGDPAVRLPLLAGAGRPYAVAAPDQAEEALARFAEPDQKAA